MSNNICFFTSIGDDLQLINYIRSRYNYDIICNYYGNNNSIYDQIKKISIYTENYQDCKFPSLHKIYHKFSAIQQYDYIFIYDDDAIVVTGSLNTLIDTAAKYNLSTISSAHHPMGKISWPIHLPVAGNHKFRYVNFIEINFPIFSKKALYDFMCVYDNKLCDYGIDHWYTKVLQPDTNHNMAIMDSVVIFNPKNSLKLNSVISPKIRNAQMRQYMKDFDIHKLPTHTIKYCYD